MSQKNSQRGVYWGKGNGESFDGNQSQRNGWSPSPMWSGGQRAQQTCDTGSTFSRLVLVDYISLSSLNEILYPHCLEKYLMDRRCSVIICQVREQVNE